MRILVLGGTKFVGRALVEAAQSANHQITIFNRGKSNPDLFEDVETLTGDRDGNLSALKGKKWDIVIDTCGYVPRIVKQSAELLKDSVDRYVFISTLSVYDGDAPSCSEGIAEDHPLKTIEDESIEEINAQTYGALKVLCEKEIEKYFAGRFLHIRPGFIVGPHDPTDRFTYWLLRASQSGEALAPNPPDRPMQFVDARDLATWTISCCEKQLTGAVNAVGPNKPLKMRELLSASVDTAQSTFGNCANFVWVDESFLQSQEVGFGSELPLCSGPLAENELPTIFNSAKAIELGLKFRSLSETISDTVAWAKSQPVKESDNPKLRAGLSAERESQLLKAWLQTKSN